MQRSVSSVMKRVPGATAIILFAVTSVAAFQPPPASQPATSQAAAAPLTAGADPTIESVQSALAQIEANPELDDALRSRIVELYKQAVAQLQLADEPTARITQFKSLQNSPPGAVEAVRKQIEELAAEPASPPPAATAPAQLDAMVLEAESALTESRKAADALDAVIKSRAARRLEIPKLSADADQRLDQVRRELDTPPAADESPHLSLARRTLLLARRKAIEQQASLLAAEVRAYDATDELLATQNELAARKVTIAEARALRLRQAVDERRLAEARRATQQAEQEARAPVARLHPTVQKLADENVALAKQLEALADKIRVTTEKAKASRERGQRLQDQLAASRKKIQSSGLTNAAGRILRKERDEFTSLAEHRRELRRAERELGDADFELVDFDEQRRALTDIEQRASSILSAIDSPLSPAQEAEVTAAIREKLETRRKHLGDLDRSYRAYIDVLGEYAGNEKKLIDSSTEYATFVSEHILWIRSDRPISAADFRQTVSGIQLLLDGRQWGHVRGLLVDDFRDQLPSYGLAAVVFAVLILNRLRVRRRLQEIAAHVARHDDFSFRPTLEALCRTILGAALWPTVVWFVGWRVAGLPDAPELAKALGQALMLVAQLYFWAEVFRQVFRPSGLGEAHFGWPRADLGRLRRGLALLLIVGLPTITIANAVSLLTTDATLGATARLVFMAAVVALAVFMHLGLRPAGGTMHTVLGIEPGGWLHRMRYVWYLAGVGVPAFLLVLAALGYVYSAARLAWCASATLWLFLSATVVNALVMRWLLLARQRLAVEQSRKRQEAAQLEAAEKARSLPGENVSLMGVPVEHEVDLPRIDVQTRKLVQSLIAFGLILGTWLIWVEVLPALGILRTVRLWSDTVTLADLLLALAIGLMTLIAAKNLPGVLEISVLQRLPLEPGERYAFSTVCRYLITVIGLVSAFGTVGVSWSSVQWLFAAITVGLGFGLQEIFGNFISGLILLFERPIRIGDTVTVGQLTGTVSRIRIRATTITDWDRKEIIIPNKEFITSHIVNWTLTDGTSRLVIRVGITYGSDTRLAKSLLLKAAKANPRVLSNPPPLAFFVGFGENSLDFELRVFVGSVDDMAEVRHQLNTAINVAFNEAKLAFAFPHREVILRGPLPPDLGDALRAPAVAAKAPSPAPDSLSSPHAARPKAAETARP